MDGNRPRARSAAESGSSLMRCAPRRPWTWNARSQKQSRPGSNSNRVGRGGSLGNPRMDSRTGSWAGTLGKRNSSWGNCKLLMKLEIAFQLSPFHLKVEERVKLALSAQAPRSLSNNEMNSSDPPWSRHQNDSWQFTVYLESGTSYVLRRGSPSPSQHLVLLKPVFYSFLTTTLPNELCSVHRQEDWGLAKYQRSLSSWHWKTRLRMVKPLFSLSHLLPQVF